MYEYVFHVFRMNVKKIFFDKWMPQSAIERLLDWSEITYVIPWKSRPRKYQDTNISGHLKSTTL